MRWIKKGFHKFFIDENGAVSIYAIIITLLLFIFNGVLIDFIRIMAAERETDQAMKAAIRSTMSSYNQGVKGYGLFGFDGGQGEASEIFKNVLNENLKQETGDYFRFIDTKVEGEPTVIVKDERMLSNKTTIEHQILEEMKYIAPMEIGKTIIEGFLQVSRGMQEASAYVDIATSIQDDVEDREDILDRIKSKLEIVQQRTNELGNLANNRANSTFPIVKDLNDVLKHLQKYREIKQRPPLDPLPEDATDEEKEARKEEEEKRAEDDRNIERFERRTRELIETIELKSNAMREELVETIALIDEAEIINNNVKKTISDKRAEVNQTYNSANEAANMSRKGTNPNDAAIDQIQEASSKLDDYVIDPEFFVNLKNKVESARDQVAEDNSSNLAGYINSLKTLVNHGNFNETQLHAIVSYSGNIKDHHGTAETLVNEAYAIITGDRPVVKDEEVKDKEEEAKTEQGNANEELEKALEEANRYLDDHGLIQQISDLARKYEGSIESSENEFNTEDPNKAAKDSMNFVDMIFGAIGDALLSSRDKIYVNEYIMTKFKSHDFKKSGAEAYSLDNNQVEYIIYGLGTTGANFGMAMTEIFAFRFAVNFLEGFTRSYVRAFGPWMWAAALVYAFKETLADMKEIRKGKSIVFFRNFRFTTSYDDYLRIFMFYHPEGNKLARTMALIEHDTSADLTTLPTYISAEATTSVKLWFLPGVTKMLGNTGVISGRVENGRYMIDKEIHYSY